MSINAKYLRIDSSDRDKNSPLTKSKSNFLVNLKERSETQRVKSVKIHQIWCPNVFYNVRSGINNVINITQDSEVATDITIPQGQYTITTFMVAAKTAIDAKMAGGSVVTITQDADTQLLTLAFSGGTNPNTALNVTDANSEAWCVFGVQTTSAEAASHTATSAPNLRGLSQVFLHSKTLNNFGTYDGDSGAISMFSAVSFHDTPFGGMGYYQSTNDDTDLIVYDKPRNLSSVQIKLRDSVGNVLDTGCSGVTIILRVDIDHS